MILHQVYKEKESFVQNVDLVSFLLNIKIEQLVENVEFKGKPQEETAQEQPVENKPAQKETIEEKKEQSAEQSE